MGMEGFAEAAHALLPGWHVSALEDVDLRAPFKFYRDEPRTLELRALLARRRRRHDRGDCRLIGRRSAAGPGRAGDRALHRPRAADARAAARPGRTRAPPTRGARRGRTARPSTGSTSTAPPTRCSSAPGERTASGRARSRPTCRPPTSRPGQPTEIAPRLIELCFQTAGVWELGTVGRMGLPTHVDRVVRFEGADEPAARCAPSCTRATATASTPRWWTRPDACASASRATGPSTLPGGVDPDALDPIRAAMDEALSRRRDAATVHPAGDRQSRRGGDAGRSTPRAS